MKMKNSSCVNNSWLSKELKLEIRKTFEPRYNKKLIDKDIEDIAENLTRGMEEIIKLKWEKYEKRI